MRGMEALSPGVAILAQISTGSELPEKGTERQGQAKKRSGRCMFVVNERAGEQSKEMWAGISGAKVPSPQAAGERGMGCNQKCPSPA